MAGMNANLSYLLSILWFVLWIVALVDCIKSSNPNKVVWILVIILLPFLGSILSFWSGAIALPPERGQATGSWRTLLVGWRSERASRGTPLPFDRRLDAIGRCALAGTHGMAS